MRRRARAAAASGALLVAAIAASIVATRSPAARAARGALVVPHVDVSPVLDGELAEAGWPARELRSGPFVGDDGAPAAPHAEARLVWRDGRLFIALYSADIDVRAGDAFRIELGEAPRVLQLVVNAAAGAPPPPGVAVARETDEPTVDDARDRDEEWTAEVSIDLGALGLRGVPGERVPLRIQRCDVGAPCSSWRSPTGSVELGP